MIEVTLCISNDAARATRAELRRLLNGTLAEKVSGDKKDKSDTATLAFVILTELKVKLDNHIRKLDDDAIRNIRDRSPTVREQRKFH